MVFKIFISTLNIFEIASFLKTNAIFFYFYSSTEIGHLYWLIQYSLLYGSMSYCPKQWHLSFKYAAKIVYNDQYETIFPKVVERTSNITIQCLISYHLGSIQIYVSIWLQFYRLLYKYTPPLTHTHSFHRLICKCTAPLTHTHSLRIKCNTNQLYNTKFFEWRI